MVNEACVCCLFVALEVWLLVEIGLVFVVVVVVVVVVALLC
jgi:hypothetical protein